MEVNKDGKWYQAYQVYKDANAFDAIAYDLAPNESSEWEVEWEGFYGELKEGEYRIVKSVSIAGDEGGERQMMATEFVIE
ncbi:immunoglobulin-like domain-containing protein [Jeotgalibacillus sp. JSM ZJ347]|uniref:immunoglobulin-like domain-containing protein n=1 Tax=Jeotgalibacillus sp. JSM ZJ347 TaxID=3342117 RepID=UPI0035A92B73